MRLFAAFLLLLSLAAPAQTKKPAHKPAPAAPAELKFVLILSRHGIRPPLTENARLNDFSANAWPQWEVALGELTPHGNIAMQQMGQYLRLRYVEDGLFPPGGCPAPGEIYLYSDTDHRNLDSTRATFNGFAPNCERLDIDRMAPTPDNKRDPLFNTVPYTFTAPPAATAEAALRTALRVDPNIALTERGNPELNELAHILAPDPAHQPAKPILKQPVSFGPGTYGASARGPLVSASSLVEDLELEYIDAKPLAQVGWGRLGSTDQQVDATLLRLLPLHIKAFGLGLRTPLFARAAGSSLLAHILATLQRASGAPSSPGDSIAGQGGVSIQSLKNVRPIGPAGPKLVYLSGHDSNLFAIGGLLGLHWHADSRNDDTPPDSQLAFELWQHPGASEYDIRIRFRAQTLMQLRSAETLSLDNPPNDVELTPTGCVAHHPCPLSTFLRTAEHALDPAFVKPELAPVTPEQ